MLSGGNDSGSHFVAPRGLFRYVNSESLNLASLPLANVLPSQRRPHRLSYRDDRRRRGRWRIIAHVQLDAVRDVHAAPDAVELAVAGDRDVGSRAERGGERRGHAPFESIARELDELRLDALERLPLALPDLDVKELKEMAISIGRRRPSALGAIEQAIRDVEPDCSRAEGGAGRGVGRAHGGGIDERGGMRGESSRVPRRVARVGAEQGDGR